MPDTTKPVTAQEAVEAHTKLVDFCTATHCEVCPFADVDGITCMVGQPFNWPDIKEAPHA